MVPGLPRPFLNKPEPLRGPLNLHRKAGLNAGSECLGDRQICVGTDVACMRRHPACLTFNAILVYFSRNGLST